MIDPNVASALSDPVHGLNTGVLFSEPAHVPPHMYLHTPTGANSCPQDYTWQTSGVVPGKLSLTLSLKVFHAWSGVRPCWQHLPAIAPTITMLPHCRFLSAHDHYRSDTRFPGFVSVMLHNDENKAAVWDLEVIPGKDPNREDFAFRLKVVANRDASATYTEGWYLTVPPGSDRDRHSNYVALTDDASLATPVFVAYY